MKKTLSIIMALCMILSVCSFSVAAAPEGTAITDEAGFLAMTADGKYYLANDITITKSYESLFTGTFDGNGKTVTVSEPMFLQFGGTIKNLTVEGAIVADHSKSNGTWGRGAIACDAIGAAGTTIVFENIVNNANVTTFTERDTTTYPDLTGYNWAGGLVGALNSDETSQASISFTNCVNNGAITGYNPCGGMIGTVYCNDKEYSGVSTVTFTNCVNNGSIDSVKSYAGGIAGRVLWTSNVTATGCINNGLVQGLGNIGGIIGHTTSSVLYMSFCQNNGEISTHSAEGESPYAGGLLGYGQGAQSADFSAANGKYANKIEFCINNGDVTGDARCGGIVGSTGHGDNFGLSHINYCINTGDVTNRGAGTSAAAAATAGILGYGYGSGAKEYAYVTNCITTGNIESKNVSKGIASYFIGYINSKNCTIANNTALGTLTSAVAGNTFCIGWNNKSDFSAESVGNSIPAGNTYSSAYESQAVSTRDFGFGTTDEAALKSGAAVYALNQAYKAATGSTEDVVYMTIDGTFVPTLVAAEDGSNSVVLNADGTYSNPAPTPEDTTAPAPEDTTAPAPETTEPPVSGDTGDSFVIFAAIAALSVLGVAVVSKKREN